MRLNKSFQNIFGTEMTLTGDIEPRAMPANQSPTAIPVVYAISEVREYTGEDAERRRGEIKREKAQ